MNDNIMEAYGSTEDFVLEVMKRCHVPLDHHCETTDDFIYRFKALWEMDNPTLGSVEAIIDIELNRLVYYLDTLWSADASRVDKKDLDIVHGLVERWYADPQARDVAVAKIGQIPFRYAMLTAIRRNDMDKMTYLVDIGLAPSDSLHLSVLYENLDAVKMLLGKGLDPRATDADGDGDQPEYIAARLGNDEIFVILQKQRLTLDEAERTAGSAPHRHRKTL